MEIILNLTTILQSIAIAMGVGSSTIAVLNFFSAIGDNVIDATERTMMGIVYIVLRVSMNLILLTTLLLTYLGVSALGGAYFTVVTLSIWLLIIVLFLNAFLMTKHIMPSTIGPALQAASWHTLGITTTLISLRLTDYTFLKFFIGYMALFILAVALVNGAMIHIRHTNAQ